MYSASAISTQPLYSETLIKSRWGGGVSNVIDPRKTPLNIGIDCLFVIPVIRQRGMNLPHAQVRVLKM